MTAADGKIVVAGTVDIQDSAGIHSAMAIARFDADGSADATFGTGGRVFLPAISGLPISQIPLFSVAVQADDKIVLAQTLNNNTPNTTYLAIELDANGSVDPNYGTQGIAEYPASSTIPIADRLTAIVAAIPQAGDKVILVGNASSVSSSLSSFAAVRLNADGSLDTTYGQAGSSNVTVTVNGLTANIPGDATVQADGKLVLVGSVETKSQFDPHFGNISDYEATAIRLNADGSLDTTYGGPTQPGVALIAPIPGVNASLGSNFASTLAVQPTDGKIVVLGSDSNSGGPGADASELYRLNTDGSLDPSFGNAGRVMTAPGVAPSINVAVQLDGKILVSGHLGSPYPVANLDFTRLNADGSTDTTFGNTSTPGLFVARLTSGQNVAVAVQPGDGKIVVAGIGTVSSPGGPLEGFGINRVLPSASTGPAALAPAPVPTADFGGLGYSYQGTYDPVFGTIQYESLPYIFGNHLQAFTFGTPGVGQTLPALADYEGLGYDQFAVYLPQLGVYAIHQADGSADHTIAFGTPGAGNSIPVPADYEGTGKADIAVYLTQPGAFAILPSNGSPGRIVPFGTAGLGQSIPAPADYYGTHQADLAVYLEKAGAFAIQDPTGATAGKVVAFGKPGLGQSIPVPRDYDGSGHIELAVYIPSQGAFYYRPYSGAPDVMVPFGTPGVGELPAPGDYDGSGRTEVAVYDPSRGFFAYRPANGSGDVIVPFGTPNSGQIPLLTPSGALPEFAAPGSGGLGGNARVPGVLVAGLSTSTSVSASIRSTRTTTVPTGPAPTSARVARPLVNQGITDSSKRPS